MFAFLQLSLTATGIKGRKSFTSFPATQQHVPKAHMETGLAIKGHFKCFFLHLFTNCHSKYKLLLLPVRQFKQKCSSDRPWLSRKTRSCLHLIITLKFFLIGGTHPDDMSTFLQQQSNQTRLFPFRRLCNSVHSYIGNWLTRLYSTDRSSSEVVALPLYPMCDTTIIHLILLTVEHGSNRCMTVNKDTTILPSAQFDMVT